VQRVSGLVSSVLNYFSGLVSSGCERAEGIWKFPFELVPTSWEIVVVDADIRLRNVAGLANVHGPRVGFTVI